MRADLAALREMIVQNLEDAQRSVERHQAMLDAIDAGCVPISDAYPVDCESDFDQANLISVGEAARMAEVPKGTI